MPLCETSIPRAQYETMTEKDRIQSVIDVCNRALDLTLEGLGIPDAEDREVMVVVDDQIPEPKMSISFTVGPHEYPGFTPEAFFPSAEKIQEVGKVIQDNAHKSSLGIGETRVEAWRNTTFVIRESETVEPEAPSNFEPMKEVGSHIREPRVTLWLSPEQYEQGSVSALVEREPGKEDDPFRSVAEKIYRLIAETLGLREDLEGQFKVRVAEYADTDVSVEFDCQPEKGYSIPIELREYAARRIEYLLNTDNLTKEGSAEIWIRQGKPETFVFTSKT